jgi:hypothetical protein
LGLGVRFPVYPASHTGTQTNFFIKEINLARSEPAQAKAFSKTMLRAGLEYRLDATIPSRMALGFRPFPIYALCVSFHAAAANLISTLFNQT